MFFCPYDYKVRFVSLYRFFGMFAPSQSLRVAMYRKAGAKIGKVQNFGSHVFIDDTAKRVIIEDNVVLSGFITILTHSNVLLGIKPDGGSAPVVIKNGG